MPMICLIPPGSIGKQCMRAQHVTAYNIHLLPLQVYNVYFLPVTCLRQRIV